MYIGNRLNVIDINILLSKLKVNDFSLINNHIKKRKLVQLTKLGSSKYEKFKYKSQSIR